MSDAFLIRHATVADVPVIARHRAEMFHAMGVLPAPLYDTLVSESVTFLEKAIPSGEYVGWLAAAENAPREIVAGAGVQLRRVLPHPLRTSSGVVLAGGRQGIVLNVFTESAQRRQGLAERLMQAVLAWAVEARLDTLVLHSSQEGRSLYERLGFEATNEMRYMGDLPGSRAGA